MLEAQFKGVSYETAMDFCNWPIGAIVVLDDEDAARKIAADFFPELKTFQKVLMVKHEGPIILRTPN